MKNKIKYLLAGVVIIVIAILGVSYNSNIENIEQEELQNVVVNDINNGKVTDLPNEIINGGSLQGEESLEVEGFEESNPDMISGASKDEKPFIVGAKQSSTVYYSQIDSRWKNHPYSAIGKSSQTIGSSGCGPTSSAMIVSSIKGTITPDDMGDLYLKHGFRSANNGTYFSAFEWTAKYFNIGFKRVYNVNDAIDLVRNDYQVVVSCSNGLFTTGGHYIVIAGIEGDTLKIYDPYLYSGKFNSYGRAGKVTVSGNTVYCSVNNFKKYGNTKGWFGFKNESTQVVPGVSKYSAGERVVVDKPITMAYTDGTMCIVDDGKSQFWIHSSVIENNRIHALSTIAYAQENNYIVQVFDNQFWSEEKYLSYPSINNTTSTPTSTTSQSGDSSKYVLGKYYVSTSGSKLNVRNKPSTSGTILKKYKNGTRFDTRDISGEWARTPSGWVSLKYCKLVYKY